ncbi:MAG: aminotransferase class V-fold PLP-dependent enzyme [Thermoplasmata archaeon]
MVNDANRFEQGIVTTPTLFGWNATLKFYEKLGIKNIENRITDLGGYLIERLQDIGCEILTPIDEDKRHGLIKYTTGSYQKDKESWEFFESPPIGKKPIKVSLRSLGGVDGMRVSCHFYNTKDDIDELVE